MQKLLGWFTTTATIFLIYASLVWNSLTALTLLKALTVVGLVALTVIWPLLILMLFVNFDKTLEAFHKSCTWSNQLLSGLAALTNAGTIYLFASVGSPLFTILAIVATALGLLGWALRYQLSKEHVQRVQRRKDIEETADRLVEAMKSRHVDADQLFRR